MRAEKLRLHNFRSFADSEISFNPYSLLIGANNAGKSNVIDAIRVFYDKEKYDQSRDWPKFATQDQEAWLELSFRPSTSEFQTLKSEYQDPNGTFTLRKYLRTEALGSDGKPKSGLYAYENGTLSEGRFYGEKNVQQGKLGDIVFIPSVSRIDEHTKLSGPSVFRDLVGDLLKKIVGPSEAFKQLQDAVSDFGKKIKSQKAEEGGNSLDSIEAELSKEISDWGVDFSIDVNALQADDVPKFLIGHSLRDHALGTNQAPSSYGQGFQRHLIFALIRTAARLKPSKQPAAKKEFSPELTWLLFEEPEVFLHPSQIDVMEISLRQLSESPDRQVLLSTHSSQFVSRNMDDLPALARLRKSSTQSEVLQLDLESVAALFAVNLSEIQAWKAGGENVDVDDLHADMEAAKHSLWLDPMRSSLFFAHLVLLVEGPTERALLAYLIKRGELASRPGLAIVDTMGKWNMFRFMNLCTSYGIRHAVLFDEDDKPKSCHAQSIRAAASSLTIGIESFPSDLENFLGVPKCKETRRKPQHLMKIASSGGIGASELAALSAKLSPLLSN